jgi:hypothetical protein
MNPFTQLNEAPAVDVADGAADTALTTVNPDAAGVRLYVFPLDAVRAVQRHYFDRQPMRPNPNTEPDS